MCASKNGIKAGAENAISVKSVIYNYNKYNNKVNILVIYIYFLIFT